MKQDSLALNDIEKLHQSGGRQRKYAGVGIKRMNLWQQALRRVVDIFISTVLLVTGFPFFLAIFLIIKLTSKGPGFFKQERVGKDGKLFIFLKLRTMKIDSDDSMHKEFCKKFIQDKKPELNIETKSDKVYKIVDDPRITGVGKFLRKSGLDELPQFINILKGEMTLVGPRPPLKYEYKYYDNWHKLRLKVKPGLTGLWQVSGRSSVSFQEMVLLDLYYIENWSLMMDLKIVLKTIPVMFTGLGGY
jgi:lipopolysaccharide/colanic/teichoic acid biosynthesis glycosyltransferase